MKFKIILKLALKHLRLKKLRSLVTIGGMTVGVGVIVFLLSFGFGLQKIVTDQLVNLNSINTISVSSQKSRILALDPNNVSFLRGISGVKEISGLFNLAGKISFGGSTTDVVVYGAAPRYLELSDSRISVGKVLPKQSNGKNIEGLINSSALETIGLKDKTKALGRQVKLKLITKAEGGKEEKKEKDIEFKIVGVVDDSAGSFVYVHEDILKELGMTKYAQVLVNVEERVKIATIRKQIENKGFTTASPIDTLNQINQVFQYFNLFLAGLGGFGLAIAAGGIFNTLTVSLLERTREIGLMKILGARKKDVLRLFLAEAMIMTFSGGILGILLAFIVGAGLNLWVNLIASQRGAQAVNLFIIPLEFALFIIAFSILLGFVTAIYPARRGTKIDPLQALKHE